ncbi:MAG: c-type cytochrome [Blastocatellia bacterium]|nr:c-type cytochrome [Blastocatellia bacterium]
MKLLKGLSLLVGSALTLFSLALSSANNKAQGEKLYQVHCAACHGPNGEGGLGPTLAAPQLTRASDDEALFKIIKDGIAGTEMPSSRLEVEAIKELVRWVRNLGQRPVEKIGGDATRGGKLYFTKGDCASCHAINGRGSAFGPDLSDIGLRRGATHLRASLIEPEADVPKSFLMFRPGTALPENFLQVRVVTADGKRIKGVRINEDTFTIHLRELSGRVHSFFKSELKELHKDWGKSPMPSYRSVFTGEEMEDVVAFLVSLRGER